MRPKESEMKVKNPTVNLKKDDVGVGCIAPLCATIFFDSSANISTQ